MRISDWSSDVCSSDLPVGDERLYARLVCEQIGAQLFECEYVSDAIDLDRSVAEAVPIPNGKSHERAYNRAVREAAHRLNVDASFVGAGGYNGFLYGRASWRERVCREV